MAFRIVSADTATPVSPDSGDIIIVKTGAVVSSAGDGIAGFSATNLTAYIDGIVAGQDNGGEFGGGANVSIGQNGALLGLSCGLWLNGTGSVVQNSGTIQSLGTGPSFIDAAIALNVATNVAITNSGDVIGSGIAVDLTSSTGTTVVNLGTVSAGAAAFTGFAGLSIDNLGTILSSMQAAFDFTWSTTGVLNIRNSGLISSPVTAIRGSDTLGDVVVNSGRIVGDVDLGAGAAVDKVINSGVIDGNVYLGGAADIYRGSSEGTVTGTVFGGGGGDNLMGGYGDDTLDGEASNDVLNGRRGDDVLFGGAGDDTLNGGADDDVLTGGSGNDRFVFRGNFGYDIITDFDAANTEKIDLRGVSTITDFADLQANHLRISGPNVLIDAGDGNVIVLQNFDVAGLQAADFVF
jgi:Hemolysin-type calcium-binding repeat (2 copies).